MQFPTIHCMHRNPCTTQLTSGDHAKMVRDGPSTSTTLCYPPLWRGYGTHRGLISCTRPHCGVVSARNCSTPWLVSEHLPNAPPHKVAGMACTSAVSMLLMRPTNKCRRTVTGQHTKIVFSHGPMGHAMWHHEKICLCPNEKSPCTRSYERTQCNATKSTGMGHLAC